jgi:hypothetical protein
VGPEPTPPGRAARAEATDVIRLEGPQRAVYLFDARLVGVNADNGRKLPSTLALIAVMLGIGHVRVGVRPDPDEHPAPDGGRLGGGELRIDHQHLAAADDEVGRRVGQQLTLRLCSSVEFIPRHPARFIAPGMREIA